MKETPKTETIFPDYWMLKNIGFSEEKNPFFKTLPELLKHPLTILVISSALIPFTIYLFTSYKSTADSRRKKALEIVAKNANFEGQLFPLYIELIRFHQSNIQIFENTSSPKNQKNDLKNLKVTFNKDFNNQWRDFLKLYSSQYLWVDDLYVEGIILRLFSTEDLKKLKSLGKEDLKKLKSLGKDEKPPCDIPKNLLIIYKRIEEYRENFNGSVGNIGDFQRELLKESYDPQNEEVQNKIIGDKSLTSRFNELQKERKEIIDDLAQEFIPESGIEKLLSLIGFV